MWLAWLAVILWAVPSLCQVQYYTGSTIPNPRSDVAACGNSEASFVCDPQSVLTADERRRANANMESMKVETTRSGGQNCADRGGSPST